MNAKKIILRSIAICVFAYLFFGCENFSDGSELNLVEVSDYLESDKRFAFQKLSVDSLPANITTSTIPTTRAELTSLKTVTKILNGNNDSGVSVPGFGSLKLGKKESSISVYYIETKVVNGEVYGIGYAVHYLYKKVKRGLSLTDFPVIAASVELQNNRTQVVYSMQTFGIKSQNLVKFFKPVVDKDFDVEGFGVMQSSIDGIHNVLSDPELSKVTKFTPEKFPSIKPSELQL